MKKPSALLLDGSKKYRAVHDALITVPRDGKPCGCALGTMVLEATNGRGRFYGDAPKLRCKLNRKGFDGYHYDLASQIADKFEMDRWTREQIAAWLKKKGL